MAKIFGFEEITVNAFTIAKNDLISFVADADLVVAHKGNNANKAFAVEIVVALSQDGGASWQPYSFLFDSLRRTSVEQIEYNGKKSFAPHLQFEVTKEFLKARSGGDFARFIDENKVVRVEEIFRVRCSKQKDAQGRDTFFWNLLGLVKSDAQCVVDDALLAEMKKLADTRRVALDEYLTNR